MYSYVQAKVLGRSLEQVSLSLCKLRQARPQTLYHGLGIVTEVYRIGKPAEMCVHLVLSCFNVCRLSAPLQCVTALTVRLVVERFSPVCV